MALAKNARTLVSAATSNTAGSTTRGRVDLNSAQGGGFLTLKMTNGGTGPTIQCTANILVAHNASLPAAGSAGSDWKTIASYGGDTAPESNRRPRGVLVPPPPASLDTTVICPDTDEG